MVNGQKSEVMKVGYFIREIRKLIVGKHECLEVRKSDAQRFWEFCEVVALEIQIQ